MSGPSAVGGLVGLEEELGEAAPDRQVIGVLQRLPGPWSNHPRARSYHDLARSGSPASIGLAHDRAALGQGQRRLVDLALGFPDGLLGLLGLAGQHLEPDQVDPAVGVGLGGVDRLAEHGLGLVRAAVLHQDLGQPQPGLEIVGVGRDRLARHVLGLAEVAIGQGVPRDAIRPRSPASWPTAGIWL